MLLDNKVFYETALSTNLCYGPLKNVSRLSQEELFLWLPIKDIIVDDPTSGLILFDIVVAHKELSIALSIFDEKARCIADNRVEGAERPYSQPSATACEPLPVTKHRPPAFSPSATAPASQPEPLPSLPMQALLSANYKKHHSQSKLLLKTAIRVFAFAGKYRGSYSNGLKSYVCPFYCSYSVYQDELLWGAAWLHKATKNPAYLNYIQVKGQTLGVDETDNTFGWDNQHVGARILFSLKPNTPQF
ncbi:hypothetical protein MRB53_023428 [Persea americana]|uniref:Uncharacterized protein n=1 Tax=Persea americana TaxID=3435 RepID=A0ACC2L9J3_PERAE|nr:hypothetical protein MRB53_023428 [Persea americana]